MRVTGDALIIGLNDGRSVTVPLEWFPRLAHGEPRARQNWEIVEGGEGVRWPELEEEIRVASLLGKAVTAGRR